MPMYTYRCKDCSETFEELVNSSEQKVKCSKCGSENVERQLSNFSIGKADVGSSCSTGTCCPTCNL